MLFVSLSRAARRRLLVLAAAVALVAVARLGLWALGPPVPAAASPRPLRQVETTRKVAALTFDVSWGESQPPRILDILKQQGVRATFFVSGPWAQAHPDLVRRMASEGHEVGSLGYQYIRLSQYGRDVIREEMGRAKASLANVLGTAPRFLRPPNGDFDDKLLEEAATAGLTVVLWRLDSHDWLLPGPDAIARRVIEDTRPGDVILLTANDNATHTDEALATAIRGLKAKGFTLVTVSELLAASRTP